MKYGFGLFLLFSTACLAQTFTIRGARIFDGENILGTRDVLVSAGKIVAVGSNIRSPDVAQIVEARGKTLLPGLIDSHVHLGGAEAIPLRASALFGVTTVISLF